jgi:PAS domain S-box-containing protein
MRNPLRILSIEDDPKDIELIQNLLETEDIACEITRVDTEAALLASLEQGGIDLILADYTLPSFDGISALKLTMKACPEVPFIFVSGTLGEEIAIEALKVGATDYVLKTRLSRLVPSVVRALREARERAELKQADEKLRRSEAYLTEAQRLSQTGSFGCNLSTGEMFWSEETFRIYGYDRSTRPAVERVLQRVHPEDKRLVQEQIDRASRGGKDCHVECRLLLPDDSVKHVRIVAHASKNEPGNIEFIGAVMDVTAAKQAEEKLRRSEAYLAEAQKLSHTGSFGWSVHSGEIFWSPETFRIFEYEPAAKVTVGLVMQRTHPEDRSAVQQLIERVSRERTEFDFEHRLLMPEGSVKYLRVIGSPSKNEDGCFEFVGAVTDITESKRAEEALRRSEQRWQTAFENSAIGITMRDRSGRFIAANSVFQKMLGYTEPELSQLSFLDVTYDEDHAANLELIRELLEGKRQHFQLEKRYRHKNGTLIWVRNNVTLVPGMSDREPFLFAVVEDITQHKLEESARRDSEARYRVVVETASDAVVSMDEDGAILLANPATSRVFGYEPAELIGKPLTILMPESMRKLHEGGFRRYLATGQRHLNWQGTELTGLRKNGEEFPAELSFGELIRNGRRVFTGFIRDISEQKRAQEALRRSEAYLAEGQRLTRSGSWAWYVRTDVLFWSQEVFRIFEFDPEKMKPTWSAFLEMVHPEDRPLIQQRAKMESMQKELVNSESDFRIVFPDGRVKHLHTIAHPVVDESGEISEVMGTVMDVTEQHQSRTALERSEAYLAESQRLTHTGSWASDATTHEALYWSEEMFRIFGFDPQQGLPMRDHWLQRIHPEDRDKVKRQASERMFVQKLDSDLEYRIVLPGGTVKHIHGLAHPVLSLNGELVEVVGTVVDITERKRAENERERLRQLQADLAHINRVSMMGELTASLAHEIKQPIFAASADAETCLRWLERDRPDLVEAQEAALRVMKDVSRASDIITRIVSLFKKGVPQRELVDVKGVIQEMIALLRGEASRYSISIHAELLEGLPKIEADRVALQQVLMNLMLNAIEAMKETGTPGKLTISTRQVENRQILVSVSDTGMGLPPEQTEQVFNTFFTSKPQGTGMGLPISRSIIESHGGRLWATSNSGPGATFQFTLPLEAAARQSAYQSA